MLFTWWWTWYECGTDRSWDGEWRLLPFLYRINFELNHYNRCQTPLTDHPRGTAHDPQIAPATPPLRLSPTRYYGCLIWTAVDCLRTRNARELTWSDVGTESEKKKQNLLWQSNKHVTVLFAFSAHPWKSTLNHSLPEALRKAETIHKSKS